jgi:hypothetical protein
MTYRTGSLPAGIMLRLCTDYGGDPLHRIFTEGGLYASIDPDRATAISVAEIIDDPSYREQSQLYIASITEAIVCAVIAHGIPERFVFAGNLLTRSENLFSLLVDRLSVVLGRDAFRISDSEGLDVKKGENHWCFSYVSINEETVMQAEAEGLQSSETDTSSMVEQFHDDVDLVFRLRAIIGYKDEFFASIKQRILQSEYETLILSPTGCFSVFDMLSPKDGPQLGEPNTHTLYVDRKNKFLHMFSYKDPVNLAD